MNLVLCRGAPLPLAGPLLTPYARGETRALLSLAAGPGKTFIAAHLPKRIAAAGLPKRAPFVCGRDELRSRGPGAFQREFGADAAGADGTVNFS